MLSNYRVHRVKHNGHKIEGKNRLILPVKFLVQQISNRVHEWYQWPPHRENHPASLVVAQANVLSETSDVRGIRNHRHDSQQVNKETSTRKHNQTRPA